MTEAGTQGCMQARQVLKYCATPQLCFIYLKWMVLCTNFNSYSLFIWHPLHLPVMEPRPLYVLDKCSRNLAASLAPANLNLVFFENFIDKSTVFV